MAKDLKITTELRNARPFIAGVSGDVAQYSAGDVLAALDLHKQQGTEHNWLYYTESEVAQFLSYKADKARLMNAGLGLTGGGSLAADRTFTVKDGPGIIVDSDGVGVNTGLGITIDSDKVKVDTSAELTWTNTEHFQNILPCLTDTYDIGSSDLLWRKIWGSELSAVVLKQYEQFCMGGLWQITKQEGSIASDVLAADTQVDFGQAMTAGDFVLFRTAGKVEYMTVGTLVSDTTYNVTRDLDGTGANDWPAGSVYAVLGQSGDGRILFDAINTPRMSVISQGATYNLQTEQIRVGDLNGNWGYTSQAWGAAIGEYASGKPNILIDPVNGLRIRNYQTDVIKLDGAKATFENFIELGTNGGLRQGTGIWDLATPANHTFTGNAIWREGNFGFMGGWLNGVKQAWFGTDGKLYAGEGNVLFDNSGLNLVSALDDNANTSKIKWLDRDTKTIVVSEIYDYYYSINDNKYNKLTIKTKYPSFYWSSVDIVTDLVSILGHKLYVSNNFEVSGNAHCGGDITCSGNITANSYINIFHNHGRQISDSNWGYRGLSIYTQDGSAPSLTFYQEGYYAGRLGLQGGKLVWGGLSLGAVAYEIFHQGNPQVVMLTNEATVYGGANLGVGNYSINVTSYGIPSGCKAVIVRISGKWNTANEGYFFTMKSSTNSRYPLVRAQVANMSIDGYGMAAVEGNILRYEVAGASSFVYLKILGYVK